MTVVVWDGITLAADRRAQTAGVPYSVTKIHRSGDTLVGVAGCLARGLAIVRWIAGGRDPSSFPKDDDGDSYATVMVVHRNGRVERFESRPDAIVVEESRHAIGSGRDFAFMAMHLGAGARRAVELTCELSVDCGNGIDSLTFDEIGE